MELDNREFNEALRNISVFVKGGPPKALKDEARLLTRDAVRYTPPFGASPIRESWAEQRKAGEAAIRRELLGGKTGKTRHSGIFLVAADHMLKNKPSEKTVRLFATKDGKVYGVDRQLFRPNASIAEMEAHHKRYRLADGRVTSAGTGDRTVGRWKFIDKMVVSKAAMDRYLKHVFKKVGQAKSGWSLAANGVGLALPNWISRGTGQGILDNQLNHPALPSITIGNQVPFIQASGKELKIMERALGQRVYSMQTRLEAMLKKAEKFNGK